MIVHTDDPCYHCGKRFRDHYDDGACAPWTGMKPAASVTQFSPKRRTARDILLDDTDEPRVETHADVDGFH